MGFIQKLIDKLRRAAGSLMGDATLTSSTYAKVIRASGGVEDLGLIAKHKVVTNAGVAYIVDAFQNLVELEAVRYHGSGTGTIAESATDTALQTEVGSRATGTTEEGASANIFKSVATISYSGSYAITEHGIFSAPTSGTLLDRSVFSAINVGNGDSIQFTYECTINAGG